MAQLLLDNGAHIDALNDAGDTPLHKAAFIGREYYCSQWKLQEAAQRAENWAQASRVSNKPGFADAWALRDERR
ncbi:Hypothetical predicted protein [Cloeon dipterum]|uniref:Ankyrin repeat domain-containing protein n=1 Tax=Cloeon dipterum TaxID=197152 RepID=A0A8S1DW16_9INSE|nr:Hypothetical predicted protein [Cloeon dipterum]